MDISSDAVQAVLSRVRFFQFLDAAERKAIADRLEVRHVPADSCLFRLGDPGEEMYVVVDGAIEIGTHDKFGQKIVLATAGHGDMFGELSLIDEGPRNATAIANQDCTLLVMTRNDLVDIVHRNPKASLEMMAILAERIRETHDRLRMLAARNANVAIETHATRLERATDMVAGWFGSLSFLAIHGGIFAVWIAWNVVAARPFCGVWKPMSKNMRNEGSMPSWPPMPGSVTGLARNARDAKKNEMLPGWVLGTT